MTREELEAEAKALYERNAPVAPRWEQLGDVTKSVWREEVERRRRDQGDLDAMLE